MAQSQVQFPYAGGSIAALRSSLSEARFGPYLNEAKGNATYALELYLYNSRLAKAFLFPLGIVEVTMRNAIDWVLMDQFGADWHLDASFRGILTVDGLSTLNKAISRVGPGATKDQVVATLTFDFWSNMLRREYAALWRTHLNRAFPNVKSVGGRHEVQQLVRDINWFRNRVAHHEPIFREDINAHYARMIDAVGMRCPETQFWMRHHSTIGNMVRGKPRSDGSAAEKLLARLDTGFLAVAPATPLIDVLKQAGDKHAAIVVVDANGCPTGAFTIAAASDYMAVTALAGSGLIDLTEHTVADVEQHLGGFTGWLPMDCNIAVALAIEEILKPKMRVLVGIDPTSGKALGILVRAHRRY